MSTKYQSWTDPCLRVPRPVQLNSRLIDGIGGISGYARAYRPDGAFLARGGRSG